MATRRGRRTQTQTLRMHGPAVAIRLDDAAAGAPVPEIRWIHAASEGSWLGHHMGPFTLTRATFEAFIRNFRADPRYQAGEDGTGVGKVLQFDYEHASEMPATSGSIPSSGAPAVGWVLDLAIRDGADGQAELWAKAKLGTQIRNQIAADEYRHVSIAFAQEATDPVSGQPIGPLLTSIAFTNHPFLRALDPLAASDRSLSDYYVRPAVDLEELCCELRCLFKLEATATASDLLAQVLKVVALATTQAAPNGIDVDGLLGAVRVLMGLPITASAEEVGQIASAVLSSPVSVEASSRSHMETNTMDPKKLAAALKVRHTLTDEEILTAAAEASQGALDLSKILESLGVADSAAALAAIPELMAAKGKLEAALTQINDLMAFKSQAEAGVQEAQVGAAMATHKLPANAKPALLNFLRADPAAFEKQYPIPEADKAKLLSSVVAGPNGVQLAPPNSPTIPATPREEGDKPIDVRAYPGRNTTEKVAAYLRDTDPSMKHVSSEVLITAAARIRNTRQVLAS